MGFLKAFHVLFVALLISSTRELRLAESRMKRQHQTPLIVTSIMTKHGDIYDCYDIYSQPSLSHPALVNHTIQLNPSNYEEEEEEEVARFGVERGCPTGSVPIRRPEEQFENFSPFIYFNESNATKGHGLQVITESNNAHGIQFAGLNTATKGAYRGTQGYCSIYKPAIDPNAQKYSSALFSIQSGYDATSVEVIQVGWTVNPLLYTRDNNVRMFILFKSALPGVTPAGGCYNELCPGFVHTNKDVAVDDVLAGSSKGPVTEQFDLYLYVEQDANTKHWWLSLRQNFKKVAVGYWPKDLFGSLGNGADTISWGGVVYTADSEQMTPPMGSGKYRAGDYQRTAYFGEIQLLDNTFNYFVPPDSNIQKADAYCYFAGDQSYKPDYGYSFGYGGVGGTDESCTR